MGTKKILSFVFIFGFVLVLLGPAYDIYFQQSAEELYESAVFKKDVDGDLKGAIELFKTILEQFPNNRNVAAKSQLQIGICSEKLGLKEAKKAYQKVVDQYPDQADAVRIAREKLYLLDAAMATTKETQQELSMKKVDIPNGEPSPDGKYLCYIDWDTGDLALYDFATKKSTHLTHAPGDFSEMVLSYAWMSGSEQIAYTWINKEEFTELRIVNRDGTNSKTLYSEQGRKVARSMTGLTNKGEVIFAHSGLGTPKELYSVSLNDLSVTNLKLLEDRDSFDFALSPDKKYIAYSVRKSEDFFNTDIKILSVDGAHESYLIEHPANDSFIGWSPKGDYILFSSNRTGTTALWAQAVENGKSSASPILIQDHLGLFWPLGITGKGKFYYSITQLGKDAYTAKLDLETGQVLSPPQRINSLYQGLTTKPVWSHDGRFLAYFTRTLERNSPFNFRTIHIRNLATHEEREISLGFEASIQTTINWTSDNTHILLRGRKDKVKFDFYKLNVLTGVSKSILTRSSEMESNPGIDIWLQDWSENGTVVYETVINMKEKIEQQKAQIIKTDLKTGTQKTIYKSPDPGLLLLILSPDEKKLALIKNSLTSADRKQTISIIPSEGGKEIVLYESLEENSFLFMQNWSPDGEGLLFTKRFMPNEGTDELWYIPAASGSNPRKIDLSMYGIRYLTFHPDGQTIAFDSGRYHEPEVWVMENFLHLLK